MKSRTRPQTDTSDGTIRGSLRLAGRVLAVAVAGVFVALLAFGLLSQASDSTIDDALGKAQPVTAPGFELEVLDGGRPPGALAARVRQATADGRVDLRELRGAPVVLNFWASWCIPCREEAPLLQRAWVRYGKEGVLFVGLNMQDVTEDAREFLQRFGQTFPNVRDPDNSTARAWGVTGIPETFFLRRDGRVVAHVIGVVSPRQLAHGVDAALTGRPAGTLDGGAQRPTR